MNILISITDELDKTVTVDMEGEGLSEAAEAVTTAISAAFGYPVECTLSTDTASFTQDGLVE